MPHLSIEYSAGMTGRADMRGLCAELHQFMVQSEVFPTAGIRVRAHQADIAIVADGLPENDFVAMTLSVGAGRGTDVLKAEGAALFRIAQTCLAAPLATQHFALSLEIRVIDPDLNWKDTPIHARLSGKPKV